jgi:hypothetical protein
MGFFSFGFEDVLLLVGTPLKVSDQFACCPGGAGEVMLALEVLDIIEGWYETWDIVGFFYIFRL